MPPPPLPIELTDTIIDHLHADRPALKACTLVCRAWRGAAQHHLLATIFCTLTGIELLLRELEAKDHPSRSPGAFAPSFATCVRELWIDRLPGFLTVEDHMPRVLAALPNLHTLHLDHVHLVERESTSARNATSTKEPPVKRYRLRQLDLRAAFQMDSRRFTEMLGLCAEVQELILGRLHSVWQDLPAEQVEETQERTRCDSLIVDGRFPLALEVRQILQLDALKAFEMKVPQPMHVPIVLEMLAAAAGSLESLTLHLYRLYPTAASVSVWESISSIPWANLAHLSLVLEAPTGDDSLSLAPVTHMLSYFSQTVSTVALKFIESLGANATLQAVGWDELEMELLRFTRLRLCTVCPYSNRTSSEEYLLETARKEMPTLASRGLLAEHPSAQIAQG